jgi:predicted alpha-1,2-mannosidase
MPARRGGFHIEMDDARAGTGQNRGTRRFCVGPLPALLRCNGPMSDLLALADPLHAIDGGGNCLPGPHLPFGIARPGPDTLNHNTNGYASGELIARFSQTHASGTGGGGRYGNIGITPLKQAHDARLSGFVGSDEAASPGYYAVTLKARETFGEINLPDPGIRCEITATARCAVYRFTFAEGTEPHLRIDAGCCIAGVSSGGQIAWTSPTRLEGTGIYRGGWGHDHPFSVHFALELDQPGDRFWTQSLTQRAHAPSSDGPHCTASIHLPGCREVTVRIGLSYTSIGQAWRNLRAETDGKDFEAVRRSAVAAWESLLSRFRLTGGTPDERALFATFLMRLHCMPDDLGTDENPWFANRVRQFNNLFCLWDSVRNANSLFALLDPPFARDLLNALLEIGAETGWTPDAWIMGRSAFVQGGCSADLLVAEACAKGLGGVDYAEALRQMRSQRATASPNPRFFGRYPEHSKLGYLPDTVPNGVSRSIEYACQDWCAARLADRLGEADAAHALDAAAEGVWRLWRDDLKSFGPLDAAGNPVPFDPWKPTRPDFWNDPFFYEGTGHDWTLNLLHAIPEVIRRHGGPVPFIAHLERYLEGGVYFWKEITLHTPWLFHYAGRPDLSADWVRRMLARHYHTGRRGLPDNEDMGSQSAFYIGSTLGIYPVAGQDLYLLNAPAFERAEIDLVGAPRPLVTRREGPTEGAVVSATLDGRPLDRAWVSHAEIAGGAELVFRTGQGLPRWGAEPPPVRG